MTILKNLWDLWKKVGFFIGNFISSTFLILFYYTIFAIFAIPFKFLSDPLGLKPSKANFKLKKDRRIDLDWFQKEF